MNQKKIKNNSFFSGFFIIVNLFLPSSCKYTFLKSASFVWYTSWLTGNGLKNPPHPFPRLVIVTSCAKFMKIFDLNFKQRLWPGQKSLTMTSRQKTEWRENTVGRNRNRNRNRNGKWGWMWRYWWGINYANK